MTNSELLALSLSKNFNWEEVTHSQTAERMGIRNTIPDSLIAVAPLIATHMEDIRTLLACPVHIDSWYRCLELNTALHSLPSSQHCKMQAVDFISPTYGTPREIVLAILSAGTIPFDQLILEYTWVHISFQTNPDIKPRGHVLTLLRNGSYSIGVGAAT